MPVREDHRTTGSKAAIGPGRPTNSLALASFSLHSTFILSRELWGLLLSELMQTGGAPLGLDTLLGASHEY